MKYDEALPIARKLIELLEPACKPGYCRIAGSLRRLKPEVGDIELVAIPDLRQVPRFGHPRAFTQLDQILSSLELDDDGDLRLHRLLGGDKYQKFWVSIDGGLTWCIQLDLFLVTPPADWGVQYLIRTGPADFSHWIVTPRAHCGGMPDGYHCQEGRILSSDNQTYIPCPEESDFFRFCGLEYMQPNARSPLWRRTVPKSPAGHILQPL